MENDAVWEPVICIPFDGFRKMPVQLQVFLLKLYGPIDCGLVLIDWAHECGEMMQ